MGGQIELYASRYVGCDKPQERLKLVNDFFTYLYETDYIDEPIVFPQGSHIDSVDVNVLYYIAEFFYGEGEYQQTVDYLTRARQCFGVVDDVSKSDVYALLGAAYFRQSAYDKAAEALNQSYEIDKQAGDFDRMSSTLNSIASVFVAAGKPQEAEKYVQEALAANSLTDNLSRRAVLFGTASELYHSLDDARQSLDYAQKALDTERQTGDSARIGVRLSQLASAQLSLSKVSDARRSLAEAIPLLQRSGNLHSWGICQNQLGDILASEEKYDEAASHYLDAAMLFLKQGDMYNELHAREGLYKVTKDASPSEAMLHLERANLLRDSIYQSETSEALSRYNAIYFNDILQREKERAERRHRTFVVAVGAVAGLLLLLIAAGVFVTWRRHRRKVQSYEQDITSLQGQYSEVNRQYSEVNRQYSEVSRQYQNVVTEMTQGFDQLTADDREFLSRLTDVISAAVERGVTDIDSIAAQMQVSTNTLHRRLSQTLSVTPKAYILRVRMNKAKQLLQDNRDLTIGEIADKCGYAQVPNLTRAFTRFFGITPTEARYKKE